MVYNVKEITTYLLYSATQQGIPVSNLKLQKLLYFLWKDYYREKRKYLFAEEFSAWKLGPVQTEIYFDYYMYGAAVIDDLNISPKEVEYMEIETKDFIETDIRNYADSTVYDLVNETHKPGGAWKRVFGNGEGNNKIIPFIYIKEDIENGK